MRDLFSEVAKEDYEKNDPANKMLADGKEQLKNERLAESEQTAKQQYSQSGLQEQGISEQDYDFPAYVQEGNSLAPVDGVVNLPNKFVAENRYALAGQDFPTGQAITKPLNDKDGVVNEALNDLQKSSKPSTGANPIEDRYALSKVALQSENEGKGIDGYLKSVPQQFDENTKQKSLGVASRAHDAEKFKQYIETGQYRRANIPEQYKGVPLPESMTVDELAINKDWLSATEYVLAKMLGGKKQDNITDEQLHQMGVFWMSQFNYNLTAGATMASRVMNSNDPELKRGFYDMMALYEVADVDPVSMQGMEYLGRNMLSVFSDPATYLLGGLYTKAYGALNRTLPNSVALRPIILASLASVPEGFVWGSAAEANKQIVKTEAGTQDGIDAGEVLASGATEAAVTAVGAGALDTLVRNAPKAVGGLNDVIQGISNGAYAAFDNMQPAPSGRFGGKERGSVGVPKERSRISIEGWDDRWYYELEDHLPNLPKKTTGAKYKTLLNNLVKSGKLKKDELRFSGLEEYLDNLSTDTLTRADIENHVRNNAFRISRNTDRQAEGGDIQSYEDFVDKAETDEYLLDVYRSDHASHEYDYFYDEALSGNYFESEMEEYYTEPLEDLGYSDYDDVVDFIQEDLDNAKHLMIQLQEGRNVVHTRLWEEITDNGAYTDPEQFQERALKLLGDSDWLWETFKEDAVQSSTVENLLRERADESAAVIIEDIKTIETDDNDWRIIDESSMSGQVKVERNGDYFDDYNSMDEAIDAIYNEERDNGNLGSEGDTEYSEYSWNSGDVSAENPTPYTEISFDSYNVGEGSIPSHYGDDPLAHARVSGFKDSNGEDYYVVQEMQSDWQQQATREERGFTKNYMSAWGLDKEAFDEINPQVRGTAPRNSLEMVEGYKDKVWNKMSDAFVDMKKALDKSLDSGNPVVDTSALKRAMAEFENAHNVAYFADVQMSNARLEDMSLSLGKTIDNIDGAIYKLLEPYQTTVASQNIINGIKKRRDFDRLDYDDAVHYAPNEETPPFEVFNKIAKEVAEYKKAKTDLQQVKNAFDIRIKDKGLRSMTAEPPMPNKWEESIFRQLVLEAIENDYQRIAWPANAQEIADMEGWGNIEQLDSGQYKIRSGTDVTPIVNRYLRVLPKYAKKFSKKYGGDAQVKMAEINTQAGKKQVFYIDIPKKIKEDARGLPLFEFGSLIGAGAVAGAAKNSGENKDEY